MFPELRDGFSLDDVVVLPLQNEIKSRQGSRTVSPAAMTVLLCLAERPGDAVDTATILGYARHVDNLADDRLAELVVELGDAFGERGSQPEIIERLADGHYKLLVEPGPLPDSATDAPLSLWEEIRQRNVFRVGVAYAAIAWLTIEVAETTFPYLHLPRSLIGFIVIASVIGFPVVLILAWLFEYTPKGVVLDRNAGRRGLAPRRMRRLDLLTLAAVVVVAALVTYQFLGEPVSTYPELRADAAADGSELTAPPTNSIAILPFENLSGTPDKAYFSDGLAEDLIHLLAKVRKLRVSPRVASYFFKGKDADIDTIAQRLQVATILTGSVRIDEDTIIVVTQLVDMQTRSQLWTDKIVRPLGDIFALQNEIAQAVVDKLRIEMNFDRPAEQPYRPPTEILGAYEFFAQAREYMRRPWDNETVDNAEALVNRALQLDPTYAAAHALLCEVNLARYALSYASDTASFETAERHCWRAKTLDATNTDVFVALGTLYRHSGQYEKAKSELRAAMEQSPLSVRAYIELGVSLRNDSEIEEAERVLRRAVELEPGYFAAHAELGNFLFTRQRYEEAVEYYRVWTELTPNNVSAYNNLAGAYFMLNDFEGAGSAWEQALAIEGTRSIFTNLGLSYYYLGRFSEALDMQREAVALAPRDHRIWGRLAESARFVAGLQTSSAEAYGKAIEFAQERLQVNPRDWETLGLLALYESHAGQTEHALITLGKGLALAPEEPDMHYFAALTYVELGNLDAAYEELQRALELGFSSRLVRADPDIAPLLDQARFQALLMD